MDVYCDGGARGNPGPAGIGVVIKDETGVPVARFGKQIGIATNNVAEYTAVVEALDWLSPKRPATRIRFFLDSQLVVSQLTGVFKVKDARLRELLVHIREKEAALGGNVSYQHIPREQNIEADTLVNLALGKR